MRTYEVSYIAAPNVADDDLAKLTSQLEHIVTDRGGKVTKIDNWGRRKMAYRISKFDEGLYSFLFIEGSGREIAEVERRLRVTDFIIRHMTVRTDEDLKRAEKVKARRKTTAVARPAEDADFDALDDNGDLEDEL
ncbi:MAG: 30S ribosomal protein S6 [Blastocatellia bacterium]